LLRLIPQTGYSRAPSGSGILPLDDPSPSHAAGPDAPRDPPLTAT